MQKFYKNSIIFMLASVSDERFLNQIRTLLKLHIQKKGGDGMNYKELIISFLDKIENARFLKAIYISVRDYVKESEGAA